VSDEVGYAEAMAELEEILGELESDHLDVDVLADRVRRASELIKLCRTRIGRAQADVDRIVTDLEAFERALDGDEEEEDGGDEDDGELF
jgi:exodeoxyribonuclease VII small subunit